MTPLIDVHTHVSPWDFPPAPAAGVAAQWPCMHGASPDAGTLFMGERSFRALDGRSWNAGRRIADMDRDGISMQVLSPMPELLSYWIERPHAQLICDRVNAQIAELVAAQPTRFRGLGAVALQEPRHAAEELSRLKSSFGFSGVEIGSNINGVALGDARFEEFWSAAEQLDLAVFVHALHPVATQALKASPQFSALVGFPLDVALAAASLIMAGVLQRYPRLRIGLSHGGGALGAILGRLDTGWQSSGGFGGTLATLPSVQAQRLFYDSNVYNPRYLAYLATSVAPGQVFVGTDYPYQIMQSEPGRFIEATGLGNAPLRSLRSDAALAFLGEGRH